jgi:ribosomal protein S12 methylthiotransferase accessory factor
MLAALLEVVERDALMIAWRNRLELPRLAVDRSTPGGVGDYVAAFADRGIDVRCCCAELDLGAPVVVAMARGTREGDPAMVVASAAAPDEERACQRALAELAANRRYVRWTMAEAREGRVDGSNGRLYALPENAAHLEPWWNGGPTRPIRRVRRSSTSADLRRLVASVADAGLETLVVDLTPAALQQLGLTVVKMLVPGAYPLDRDARWPHLGGRRLRHTPVAAGLRSSPLPRAALNRLPHPLP